MIMLRPARMFFMPVKILLFLSLCCLISSCGTVGRLPGMGKVVGEEGYFRDQKGDYLEAETIPRTKIPAGMDNYILDDLLVVPNARSENVQAFLEVPRPRSMSGNPDRGVVIQRMNERSWIIVDASASQVWPRIRDYWRSSEIGLSYEDPTSGVLETEWFVMSNNVLTREKMRITVEPGFQDNSSEIKLLHLSAPQATPIGLVEDRWPEKSADPELEYELLTALSGYLADVSGLYQATSVSFLAGSISTEGKASIIPGSNGDNILRLDADYDRSWAAVGRALSRAGISIMSEDRSVGTYDVSYSIDRDEDEKGFFGRVVTLNGLLFEREADSSELHSLQIKLWDEEGRIDVLIESLEPEAEQAEDIKQAQESLLQAIRQFIA